VPTEADYSWLAMTPTTNDRRAYEMPEMKRIELPVEINPQPQNLKPSPTPNSNRNDLTIMRRRA